MLGAGVPDLAQGDTDLLGHLAADTRLDRLAWAELAAQFLVWRAELFASGSQM